MSRPVVDVIAVVLSLSTCQVVVTASCPGSEQDNSIQTCVEDLVLDTQSWRTIDALRDRYYDFPVHCRYGQCSSILLCLCVAYACVCGAFKDGSSL